MKRQRKTGRVAKVKAAYPHAIEADASEAFRRARSSLAQIRTDLHALRRQTASAVDPRRSSKSK